MRCQSAQESYIKKEGLVPCGDRSAPLKLPISIQAKEKFLKTLTLGFLLDGDLRS